MHLVDWVEGGGDVRDDCVGGVVAPIADVNFPILQAEGKVIAIGGKLSAEACRWGIVAKPLGKTQERNHAVLGSIGGANKSGTIWGEVDLIYIVAHRELG